MERIITPEERIKRAEEIYYQRKSNSNSIRMPSAQVKDGKEKKQFALYKKMILQVLICVLIYLVFSVIKEANYIFSEGTINKTKEFLSQDINFEVIAGKVSQFFQDNQDKFNFISGWLNENDKKQEQNDQSSENGQAGENNQQNKTENKVDNQENKQENSQVNNENSNTQSSQEGKTNEQSSNTQTNTTNTTTTASATSSSATKTQMQIDAEYIKKNFSMTLPVKGKVTSRYGRRTPTEIVSENHQGIDIGVSVGTSVVAAMEGKVSLVSDKGEYGVHVKIVNKDITTIYAHCSKILVKEGATVKKGQKIALSGNTGKTTGPHLHFEVRRGTRTVNPELILSF